METIDLKLISKSCSREDDSFCYTLAAFEQMAVLYFITLAACDKYESALLASKNFFTPNVWVTNAEGFNNINVNLKNQDNLGSK